MAFRSQIVRLLLGVSLFLALVRQSVPQPVEITSKIAIPDTLVEVVAVFGNGIATSTDSLGLIGSVNTPFDSIFDVTESYLYMTDQNGGGLLRKLAVAPPFVNPFNQIYTPKTIFNSVNLVAGPGPASYLAISKSSKTTGWLYHVSNINFKILRMDLSQELTTGNAFFETVAGTPLTSLCNNCAGNADGFGTYASFSSIAGIALERTCDTVPRNTPGKAEQFCNDVALWVVDSGNGKLRAINITQSGLFTVVTVDDSADVLGDSSVVNGGSGYLAGIAIDNTYRFLVVGFLGCVYMYDITGQTFPYSSVAATRSILVGSFPNYGYQDNVDFTLAVLGAVNYIALDGDHNIYISDIYTPSSTTDSNITPGTDTIRRIDTNTGAVTTVAGSIDSCTAVTGLVAGSSSRHCFAMPSSGSGGVIKANIYKGTQTFFYNKIGFAVNYLGNLMFVADTKDNAIRKVYCGSNSLGLSFGKCIPLPGNCSNPLAVVKTPAGNGCPTSCDGLGIHASFHMPNAVAAAPPATTSTPNPSNTDYIYVADFGGNAIRQITVGGAMNGDTITIADGSEWYHPLGIAVDGNTGDVLVTDLHRVSKIKNADLIPGSTNFNVAGSTVAGDLNNDCLGSSKAGSKVGTTSAGSAGAGSAGGSKGSSGSLWQSHEGFVPTQTKWYGSASSSSGSSAAGTTAGTKRSLIELKTAAGTVTGTAAGTGLGTAAGTVKSAGTASGTKSATGVNSSTASGSKSATGVTSSVPAVYSCMFNTPVGIALDPNMQYAYVVDSGSNAIRIVDYGDGSPNYGAVGIFAESPDFNTPYGIALDLVSGNFYVTSFQSHVIFQVGSVFLDPDFSTLTLATYTVYAGSSIGMFGHTDNIDPLSAVFMHPTGISYFGDFLYVNEWYKLPGSEFSSSDGSSDGTAKSGSNAGTTAGTKTAARRSLSAKENVQLATKSGTVNATASGTKGGSGGSTKSDTSALLFTHESDINYGHEPQYLHNVRAINLNTNEVTTVAGSYRPGIFEPSEGSHGSGSGSEGSHGSGSGGSVAGSKSGWSTHTEYSNGFYSYNSTQCPSCSEFSSSDGSSNGTAKSGSNAGTTAGTKTAARRSLSAKENVQLATKSGTVGATRFLLEELLTAKTGGTGTGTGTSGSGASSDSHLPGAHWTSHVGSVAVEDGSFNDGFSNYARFFRPTGIVAGNVKNTLTLWIADFGNNRVRNITCSNIGMPSLDPTTAPTMLPTADPTEKPTRSPTVFTPKAKKGLGRGGKGRGGKGRGGGKVKGFGYSGVEGTTGVDVAVGTARGLDTPVIWTIAAGCAAFVALAAVALYYRKRLLASVKSLNA